jgi:hypothetical protein
MDEGRLCKHYEVVCEAGHTLKNCSSTFNCFEIGPHTKLGGWCAPGGSHWNCDACISFAADFRSRNCAESVAVPPVCVGGIHVRDWRRRSSAPVWTTPKTDVNSSLWRALRSDAMCHKATYAVQQTAVYSITSSARASSVSGTVRPSAFAVLRLIASSYLVGACTGRSAGFSPLRMRST